MPVTKGIGVIVCTIVEERIGPRLTRMGIHSLKMAVRWTGVTDKRAASQDVTDKRGEIREIVTSDLLQEVTLK